MSSFPYMAKAIMKYKTPHATDLAFAKGDIIRVTAQGDDDEDWLIGESEDGERKGGFPKDFVEPIEEKQVQEESTSHPSGAPAFVTQPIPAGSISTSASTGSPNAMPVSTSETISKETEVHMKDDEKEIGSTSSMGLAEPASSTPSESQPGSTTTPIVPPSSTIPSESSLPTTSSNVSTPSKAPSSTITTNTNTRSTADPAEPSTSSFKDRLAAFNKSGSGSSGSTSPPALKPKPAAPGGGGWAWKQKQAALEKERELEKEKEKEKEKDGNLPGDGGITSSTGMESATPSTATEEKPTTANSSTGMSASDAKESITKGLSLKERMAALQGAGAFGEDDSKKEKKVGPPVGSKPKVWKRPEVPVGMDGGGDDPSGLGVGMGMPPPPVRKLTGSSAIGDDATDSKDASGMTTITKEAVGEGEEEEEEKDDSEAQAERERRAAIAARMQRLGGRGMMGGPPPIMGPKPVRKTTSESVTQQSSTAAAPSPAEMEGKTGGEVGESEKDKGDGQVEKMMTDEPKSGAAMAPLSTTAPTANSTGGGSGIILPAMPKRTGPPKRRAGTAGSGNSATAIPTSTDLDSNTAQPAPATTATSSSITPGEEINDDGRSAIPDATNNDEEIPIERTEEQKEKERMYEEVGKGAGGVEGAKDAGIAMKPLESAGMKREVEEKSLSEGKTEKIGGAGIAAAPMIPRTETDLENQEGTEEEEQEEDEEEIQDDEEDAPPPPPARPVTTVPLHDAPTSPSLARSPPRSSLPPLESSGVNVLMAGVPKDEVELKREAEAREAEEASEEPHDVDEGGEEDEEAPPPPPPSRSLASVPSPSSPQRSSEKPAGPRAMPRTPSSATTTGLYGGPIQQEPQTLTHSQENRQLDEVIDAPHLREPTIGEDTKLGVPMPATEESQIDADAQRRQGIAARMAKLGGIKLGGPPLTRGMSSDQTALEEGSGEESIKPPMPPSRQASTLSQAAPLSPADAAEDDDDETEEAASKRRQATLARLRAGGSLGFGMFSNSHGHIDAVEEEAPTPTESANDDRGVQVAAAPVDEEIPPAPSRAAPPASALPPPPADEEDTQEDEEAEDEPAPPVPSRTSSEHPRRSMSMLSTTSIPASPGIQRQGSVASSRGLASPLPMTHSGLETIESNVYEAVSPARGTLNEVQEDDDDAPPPPVARAPGGPGRSESRMSRDSRTSFQSRRSMDSPASPIRTSSSGARPAFVELQQAAGQWGSRVLRAANSLGGNSKAVVGDGSSRALVWQAMADAGLDANKTFGSLVWEQEGASVQQKFDEPRNGDIVVLHDCKLSGKRMLKSYSQHFGSVQEPQFAICTDFESKKNKVDILTVEKGHPTKESLKLEELKGGLIRVFRPMP